MVTAEQIRAARTADLYEYLRLYHPDEIKREGHWLRLKTNPSICTKQGLGGYKDYATFESGNSIDFLVRHLNYDFMTAVTKLTELCGARTQVPSVRTLIFPERSKDASAVRSYLTSRGFTDQVVNLLMSENLLYQDIHRNAVFRSAEGDFLELRGTRPGQAFHQCGKMAPDRYWCFIPSGKAEKAFICESAIDAVSLYLLHLRYGEAKGNAYCGIAGVANQKVIERIQTRFSPVIAVDNDEAGQHCRLRNSSLPALIPQGKDWNDDLMMTTRRF